MADRLDPSTYRKEKRVVILILFLFFTSRGVEAVGCKNCKVDACESRCSKVGASEPFKVHVSQLLEVEASEPFEFVSHSRSMLAINSSDKRRLFVFPLSLII